MYKVWAEIERSSRDTYTRVDEPVTIGYFATLAEARAFVTRLSADGYDSQGNPCPIRKGSRKDGV